jgi:hypothetical protein
VFSIGVALITIGVLLALPSFPHLRQFLHITEEAGVHFYAAAAFCGVGLVFPLVCLGLCVCHATPSARRRQRDDFVHDSLLEELLGHAALGEHYDCYGHANAGAGTVLLLAGASAPRVVMRAFAESLAEAQRVIVVDLPGHGTLVNVPFSLARCDRVLCRVLEREFGLRPSELLMRASATTAAAIGAAGAGSGGTISVPFNGRVISLGAKQAAALLASGAPSISSALGLPMGGHTVPMLPSPPGASPPERRGGDGGFGAAGGVAASAGSQPYGAASLLQQRGGQATAADAPLYGAPLPLSPEGSSVVSPATISGVLPPQPLLPSPPPLPPAGGSAGSFGNRPSHPLHAAGAPAHGYSSSNSGSGGGEGQGGGVGASTSGYPPGTGGYAAGAGYAVGSGYALGSVPGSYGRLGHIPEERSMSSSSLVASINAASLLQGRHPTAQYLQQGAQGYGGFVRSGPTPLPPLPAGSPASALDSPSANGLHGCSRSASQAAGQPRKRSHPGIQMPSVGSGQVFHSADTPSGAQPAPFASRSEFQRSTSGQRGVAAGGAAAYSSLSAVSPPPQLWSPPSMSVQLSTATASGGNTGTAGGMADDAAAAAVDGHEAALDAVDLSQSVVVIAWGAASYVATHFALRHPDVVAGIAAAGPVPDFSNPWWRRCSRAWCCSFGCNGRCMCFGHAPPPGVAPWWLPWIRAYRLRWLAALSNLGLKSRIQTHARCPPPLKQDLLRNDFHLGVLPDMVTDIRRHRVFLSQLRLRAALPVLLVSSRRLSRALRSLIPAPAAALTRSRAFSFSLSLHFGQGSPSPTAGSSGGGSHGTGEQKGGWAEDEAFHVPAAGAISSSPSSAAAGSAATGAGAGNGVAVGVSGCTTGMSPIPVVLHHSSASGSARAIVGDDKTAGGRYAALPGSELEAAAERPRSPATGPAATDRRLRLQHASSSHSPRHGASAEVAEIDEENTSDPQVRLVISHGLNSAILPTLNPSKRAALCAIFRDFTHAALRHTAEARRAEARDAAALSAMLRVRLEAEAAAAAAHAAASQHAVAMRHLSRTSGSGSAGGGGGGGTSSGGRRTSGSGHGRGTSGSGSGAGRSSGFMSDSRYDSLSGHGPDGASRRASSGGGVHFNAAFSQVSSGSMGTSAGSGAAGSHGVGSHGVGSHGAGGAAPPLSVGTSAGSGPAARYGRGSGGGGGIHDRMRFSSGAGDRVAAAVDRRQSGSQAQAQAYVGGRAAAAGGDDGDGAARASVSASAASPTRTSGSNTAPAAPSAASTAATHAPDAPALDAVAACDSAPGMPSAAGATRGGVESSDGVDAGSASQDSTGSASATPVTITGASHAAAVATTRDAAAPRNTAALPPLPPSTGAGPAATLLGTSLGGFWPAEGLSASRGALRGGLSRSESDASLSTADVPCGAGGDKAGPGAEPTAER